MIDPLNNSPEYSSLPIAYIAWINQNDEDPYPKNNSMVFFLIFRMYPYIAREIEKN